MTLLDKSTHLEVFSLLDECGLLLLELLEGSEILARVEQVVARAGGSQIRHAPTEQRQSRQINHRRLHIAIALSTFSAQLGRFHWIIVAKHVVASQENDAALRQPRGFVHLGRVDPAMRRKRVQSGYTVLQFYNAVLRLDVHARQHDILQKVRLGSIIGS